MLSFLLTCTLSICLTPSNYSPPKVHLPSNPQLFVQRPPQNPSQKKFRWKHVFRPVKIFQRKLRFWLAIAAAGAVFLASFFFIADNSGGLDGDIFYVPFGIMVLAMAVVASILVALPIIFIIRFFKEIQWGKRYRKCKFPT